MKSLSPLYLPSIVKAYDIYSKKCSYCDDDSFWKHAQWIDYFERKNARWSDVEYFIKRYTNSLQFDNYEIEHLY